MQSALRLETTVLPGHRLEISVPELPEGTKVEVIVGLPETPEPRRISMLELLASLPPAPAPSRPGKSTNSISGKNAIPETTNVANMGGDNANSLTD